MTLADKDLESVLELADDAISSKTLYTTTNGLYCLALTDSMSNEFQQTVAMDLKFFNNKIILHIIDLCTRLSAAAIIPSKNKETIIKEVFKIWIAVYGKPEKFLLDNGGEWANDEFLQMCDSLGINIQTTAAESPWSNGVVERHNQTLANMMNKIIHDTNCAP